MKTNEKFIKVSGKFPIERELELGDDVVIEITGGIVKIETLDNQDGTKNQVHILKPIEIKVLSS